MRRSSVSSSHSRVPRDPDSPQQHPATVGNLAHLDIAGFSEKLNKLLTQLDTSFSQLNVADINAGVTNLLGAANRLVTTPTSRTPLPLCGKLWIKLGPAEAR